jgi:signal transduction histidine kinase
VQFLMRENLDSVWLATLQQVVDRAAHEIKDSLNGVSLNVEVIRSRSEKRGLEASELSTFAQSASAQLEQLCERTESLLFLSRPSCSGPTDVALALKHLATLLVPATKADGGTLTVDGWERAALSSAPAQAVRLALGAGLLAVIGQRGAGRCSLDAAPNPVVRFSHESAVSFSLDPVIAGAIAEHKIEVRRSDGVLLIVFPGP